MEHYKISKLSNDSTVTKFVTKQWVEKNDLSSGQYSVNKNIRFKTSMVRSYLCDYNDACVVVKGTIDLLAAATNKTEKAGKEVSFKNNAQFRSCTSQTNSKLTENADDLGIVMPIYNLLEHSHLYDIGKFMELL